MKTRLMRCRGRETSLIVQHRTHLSDDFSGGKVPFYSEQRGQAELAIHRAADLAGHTNGGAFPGAACRLRLVAGLAAVAGLSAVAFRHPDGFHALPVAHRPPGSAPFRRWRQTSFRSWAARRKFPSRARLRRKSCGQSRNLLEQFQLSDGKAPSKSWRARYEGCPNSSTSAASSGS